MNEAWKEMLQFFQDYYQHGIVLYMYFFSLLIILLVGGKRLRKLICWPTILIMVVVFNPIFYQYVWKRCFEYGYWRVLWLFPSAIVIGTAIILLLDKIKNRGLQAALALIMFILISCNGKNMFSQQLFYTKTENIYKLPQEAIDVSDALLELEHNPKVVMCSELYSYVRQYTTDIKLMYGRNVEGYIGGRNDKTQEMASNLLHLENADWARIAELMRQEQYKYLVLPDNENCSEEYIKQYSFTLLKKVDGYNIIKID